MDVPREIELKLAVAPPDLPRLRERLARIGAPRVEKLETVYYDTEDFALAARGMALRVRRAGRRWLQTLKTADAATALTRRGEWEMPAPRGRLDLARFAGTPLEALLRTAPALKIEPRFRTRFTREVWRSASGAIEIALDEGEISAGGRSTPICELELELKAGDTAALWALALDLVGTGRRAIALLPYGDSKAARGVGLAHGRAVQPVKANAAAFGASLDRRTTAGAALRSVIGVGTTVLAANAHGLRDDDDPEFIHQARVAVRRMRSAIRLLSGASDFPHRLDAELRWIGRVLGAARDWDVFVLHTAPAQLADAAPRAWLARAQRSRDRARAQARAALASVRFALLALRLLQWSGAQDADDGPALHALAPRLLARAHGRLVAAARSFDDLTPAQRHRVRILAKRLRYALDLMVCALPAQRTAKYVAQLAQLQDQLGALNDLAVGRALLAACELAPRARADLRRRLRQPERELVQRAARLLRTLARRAPPWPARAIG